MNISYTRCQYIKSRTGESSSGLEKGLTRFRFASNVKSIVKFLEGNRKQTNKRYGVNKEVELTKLSNPAD